MNPDDITVLLTICLVALLCFKVILFIHSLRRTLKEKNEEIRLRDELFAVLTNSVDDIFIMTEKQYNIVSYISPNIETIEVVKTAEPCYDLVLMDIEMPVMDGYECARNIRDMGFDREKLPIIALTANVFSEDRISTIENGMNEYMTKPFDINNLLKVLYKYLK